MTEICFIFIELDDFPPIENTVKQYLEFNIMSNNMYCLYHNGQQNQRQTLEKITYIQRNPMLKLISDYINLDNYGYLCILTNQFAITRELSVDNCINLLNDNHNLKQLILTECLGDYQCIYNNLEIPMVEDYRKTVDNSDFRFNYIKEVFDKEKLGILANNDKAFDTVDYNLFVTGNYSSYFRFLPSIIKIDQPSLKSVPLISNSKGDVNLRYYNNIYLDHHWISGYYNHGLVQNSPIVNKISLNQKEMTDDMTIVTGYIKVGGGGKKHKYDYLEKAKYTLAIPNNMVIFISQELEQEVIAIRRQHNLLDKTHLIILNVDDLYMYDNKEYLDGCCQKNKIPYNNSLYIMAVNSRYSYLERAIQLNYFRTNYFAWVDFGLGHIAYMDKIFPLYYNNPDKVRISWVARKNLEYNHKVLGGGIYMAHRNIMLELCRLHDIEFKINLAQGHCINDDKTLFFIYLKYPELFDIYFSGYNLMYNKII